jgi:site-specific recombinase XerD
VKTAQAAIADFLTELHERGYAFGTRRLRGTYLTEYLEHAQNTPDTPRDLAAADLMDLERADAWLAAAAAGELRQRNTLHGPRADSSEAAQRSRVITYNVFAAHLGTPWRLDVPPNSSGEHLDPAEAAEIARKLAVQRPASAHEPTWIRTAALASLVAATGRTVRELAELDVSNLQLQQPPPRLILEDGPEELDEDTVRTVRRWLRQRVAIIDRSRQEKTFTGTDPGYLWIPTKHSGYPHRGPDKPIPLGARRATMRTLHACHRRLVLSLLGHPLRLGELRPPEPPAD